MGHLHIVQSSRASNSSVILITDIIYEYPIYTQAQSQREAQELKSAGLTEVIVEMDELPRSLPYLLLGKQQINVVDDDKVIPIQNLLNVIETKPREKIRYHSPYYK